MVRTRCLRLCCDHRLASNVVSWYPLWIDSFALKCNASEMYGFSVYRVCMNSLTVGPWVTVQDYINYSRQSVCHCLNCPFGFIIRSGLSRWARHMYESILKTNCLNISAAYCGPLSDITTSGMPWCANNYFKVFDDRIGVGSLELTDFEESQVIIDRNKEFRVMQVKQVCSHAFPWPPWKLSGSQCFARSAHICNLTRHVLPPVVPSGGPCICVCPDAPRISARRSLGIMIRDPSRRSVCSTLSSS